MIQYSQIMCSEQKKKGAIFDKPFFILQTNTKSITYDTHCLSAMNDYYFDPEEQENTYMHTVF